MIGGKLLGATSGGPSLPNAYLVFGLSSSPYVKGYLWSGSQYTAYSNPATLPTSAVRDVQFAPSGTSVAIATNLSPWIGGYSWSSSGFGSKLSNPSSLPSIDSGDAIDISPNSANAVVGGYDTVGPYIAGYPWSSMYTRYTSPTTSIPGPVHSVKFSPNGSFLAIGHGASPYVSVYGFTSGTGYGSKSTNPASLPPTDGDCLAYNPAGTALAIGHRLISPYITVYSMTSGGGGFGTKFSNPATLPPGNVYGVTFSPSGDALAVGHAASPYVSVYPWSSSGFGSKYADPSVLPPSSGLDVVFHPSGDGILVVHSASPYISAYAWSTSGGFGAKYADPATPLPSAPTSVTILAQ